MSKRKKEIKKRKQLAGDFQKDESLLTTESAEDIQIAQDSGPGEPEDLHPPESPIDDSQILTTPLPSSRKKPGQKKNTPGRQPKAAVAADSWLGQNKENFLLGLLVLYVFLLGLGTVGELFEIEWILNLPLFR
ncbi:MAG: hypothetical protein P1S59_01290 [bacterium]|nr:hypothetical protein [bacterium]